MRCRTLRGVLHAKLVCKTLVWMETMWMLRSLAVLFVSTCLLVPALDSSYAEPAPAPGSLSIGSISELDTEEIHQLIDRASSAAEVTTPESSPLVLSLEEAIRVALEANLQLQIALIDRNVAEALVPAARAKFHPVPGFDAVAGAERLVDAPDDFTEPGGLVPGTYEQNAQAVIPFVRQELPTGGTATVSTQLLRDSIDDQRDIPPDERSENGDRYLGGTALVLRQPLLRGGSVYVARRLILDSEYNLSIAEAQLRAQILQVTAQVKEAYFNTILAKRLIEVTEAALKRDHDLLEASRALFEAGRATRRDVLSAEIRISDGEASLANNHAAFSASQLALRNVLGTPIDRPVQPAEATIPFEPIEIRLAQWIPEAIENRPEIRAVLARLDQSALAVRIASNDVLPALDFIGSYARAGFSDTSRTTWDMDSQAWAVGLHFEIPFGNVAARERLRAARLLNERVERELSDLQRGIEIEVRTEAISLRQNFGVLSAQVPKVEQARAKLETANTRFRLGLADNFDVTDAQEDVVAAETQLLTAIVDYVNSLARLEARIAGPL
jgi:outer membrane protein TolC